MSTFSSIGLIIDGTDQFFTPIASQLASRYQVEKFQPQFVSVPVVGSSMNKLLLERYLSNYIQRHRLIFFEWAGAILVQVTNRDQLPSNTRLVTRLHSVEVATAASRIDWSKVDRVMVVSRHMKESLMQAATIPPDKIVVIPNGVDVDHFYPPQNQRFDFRLGMACRIHPIKRVYEAILTIGELRNKGYPYTLHIAGDFDNDTNPRYSLAIQRIIQRLALEEAVFLDGYVSDMARWYRECDVFLSNSYWEGQQVSLLEAMSSGCYCLAHDWGGVEEVLPEDNIFISEKQLQRKLELYADLEDESRQQLQKCMRSIAVESFDQMRMVNEILALIGLYVSP